MDSEMQWKGSQVSHYAHDIPGIFSYGEFDIFKGYGNRFVFGGLCRRTTKLQIGKLLNRVKVTDSISVKQNCYFKIPFWNNNNPFHLDNLRLARWSGHNEVWLHYNKFHYFYCFSIQQLITIKNNMLCKYVQNYKIHIRISWHSLDTVCSLRKGRLHHHLSIRLGFGF